MNVLGEVKPLVFVFDENVFISALVDSTRVMVSVIVIHGVGNRESTHEIRNSKGAIFLAYHKVKVIGHEAIGK